MTRREIVLRMGLCATVLLAAGCGNDRSPVTFQRVKPLAATGAPAPSPASKAFATPASSDGGDDPLAAPDQLATGSTSPDRDSSSAAATDPEDLLADGPKIPTRYRHWLTVEQYDSRITIRVNGIGLGGYAASQTTDITMRLHPGSNTITLIDAPNTKGSWVRLYVTRDPPLPQLQLFPSAGSLDISPTDLKTGKPQMLTRTFTFTAG